MANDDDNKLTPAVPPGPAPGAARAHWTERLQRFDRRWIFLAMGIGIVLPLLFPIGLPTKASPMVRSLFNTVEELKEGDTVLVSLDVDPASTPELDPFYRAVILHLKRKNVKLVMVSTWYAAPPLVERWIRETIEQPIIKDSDTAYTGARDRAYKKGIDYAWLGFRSGDEAMIASMGKNLRETFDGRTADGTALDQTPVMQGMKRLKDFKLIVMVSAGFPGIKEYMQQVQTRYDLRMVGACTAVSTTDLAPYFQSGQLLGLAGGLAASAEYEQLVGKPGSATQGADVLNISHGLVILAIVFGNVIYFVGKRRRRRS